MEYISEILTTRCIVEECFLDYPEEVRWSRCRRLRGLILVSLVPESRRDVFLGFLLRPDLRRRECSIRRCRRTVLCGRVGVGGGECY